jgi:hypothetical protein
MIKLKFILASIGFILMYLAFTMPAKAESDWPPMAVIRNARSMATTGREANCIMVAHIKGALPYCLAMIKKEPDRCSVIQDEAVKTQCREDAK